MNYTPQSITATASTLGATEARRTELGELDNRLTQTAKSLADAYTRLVDIANRIYGQTPQPVSDKQGPPPSRHCELAALNDTAGNLSDLVGAIHREIERLTNL